MAKNVEVEIKGKMLVITVKTDEEQGPSKSGKTTIVGTTSGEVAVGPGLYANINVYKK